MMVSISNEVLNVWMIFFASFDRTFSALVITVQIPLYSQKQALQY